MKRLYKAIVRELDYYIRDFFINGIAASMYTPIFIRVFMYKLYGIKTNSFSIKAGCFFGRPTVSIGQGTFINYNCFFESTSSITIGKNCAVAMNVTFCTSAHRYDNPKKRAGHIDAKPITVGDGVWIGANCTILPGVNIGDGCVIASGSVVTKDCEPHSVYAGVPAKKLKDLSEVEPILKAVAK